jgi:serine/threonine-protein kinase
MAIRDPQRFRRARELFHAALELSPEQRAALLTSACADDDALFADVQRLLEDAVHDPEARTEPAAPPGRPLHSHIDRYRIVRLLGRGGMGEVYLAQRDAGDFEQTVALKLIRDGGATHASRFLRERSILASLSHPNIAHLLDGGLTEAGQLWFAMEYVEGQTLVEWCDQRRLGLAARVRLFLRLCAAVEFAHRNLVVHRDIKPANVLVDAEGQPKLLDFGIAKLLADADTAPQQTQTLAMTPAYASPEQRRGEPASLACDVYQLGLVLYELLSGLGAHGTRPRADQPPAPMATALAKTGTDKVQAIARHRDSHRQALLASLRGDLGRIVRKATAEEPVERYPGAGALARDLQRWLDHRPVQAHRGALPYRLRKFVRRNWVATLASTLLVLASVVYVVQLREQHQRTTQARDRAEAIAGFMQELFSASDPRVNLAADSTVREALALGAQRLTGATDLDPLTHARLLTTVARSHQSVALYQDASALYQRALDRLAARDDAVALELRASALAGQAFNDLEAGATGNAVGQAAQADALLERLPDDAGLARAWALTAAAVSRENLGDSAGAEPLFERLRLLHPTVSQADPKLVGDALLLHGSSLYHQGQFARAEAILQQAAAHYRERFGEHYPDYGRALAQLGNPLAAQGRHDEAEASLRRGIEVMAASLGERHRDVGTARNDLARLYLRAGRFDQAEPLLESALALIVETYGADHPYVTAPLINLGFVAWGQQRPALAQTRFERALGLALLDDSTPMYRIRAWQGLGRVRCAGGDGETGLALLRQARRALDAVPDRQPEADWLLAECHLRQGQREQARTLLAAALPGLRAHAGADGWETLQAEAAWQQLQPPP